MVDIGKNTTISIIPESGSASYVEGACVREIAELSSTANALDVTCYGSGNVAKKIKTVVDLGSMTVTIAYNGKTTGAGLWNALQTRESCNVTISMTYGTAPTTDTLTFSALITGVTLSVPKDDVMTQKITLTLDGRTEPTFA